MERKKHTAEDRFAMEPRRNRYTDLVDKELEGLEGRAYIDRLTEIRLHAKNAFDYCWSLENDLSKELIEKIMRQMTDLRNAGRWPNMKYMDGDQRTYIGFDFQCGDLIVSSALSISRGRYIIVDIDETPTPPPAKKWLLKLERRLRKSLSELSSSQVRGGRLTLFGTTPFLVSALPRILDTVEEMRGMLMN